MKTKGWVGLTVLAVFLSLAIWLTNNALQGYDIDPTVLLIGNLVVYVASLLAWFYYSKAGKATRGHKVTGNVMAGFVIKFFMIIVALIVYFAFSDEINRNAILVLFVIYLLYSFLGTSAVTGKKKGKRIK